ncbi:MAG: helix-hairpin-helix domain-containing protein [Actinobacteria bacterium]|nr:helix-hairpin-helix domain-containing protein [Actinomycetota bacterium]
MEESGFTERLRRASQWLDATPSELTGLAVLLVGGLALTGYIWMATPRGAPPLETVTDAAAVPTSVPVIVHVAGAVLQPGVLELPSGARVGDALAAAGGARADADLDAINLARVLSDGEQLHVPVRGMSPGVEGEVGGGSAAGAWRDGVLDLNAATTEDLEQLPGIGPVLAQRIADWRDEHGPFREVGELRDVPGIGERTFQALADVIAVS